MTNEAHWHPTRIIERNGRFRPNPREIFGGSWMLVNLFLPYYVRAMRANLKGQLLDCGCGRVPYYAIYRPQVEGVTCVDWALSPHENNHIDDAYDLNEGLPYPDACFDSVLLTDVLEHLHSPTTLLKAVHRTLRPGGRVVIGVPFLYRIHERPHDFHRYTEFALRKMTEDTGFRTLTLDAYGSYLEVLFDLLHKKMTRNKLVYGMLEGLRRGLLALPPVRRLNEKWRADYPLGYCMVVEKKT